ncbi:MAG: efflux RND transporter periplasmic adaptor subunit [Verrucomicrobiales bacterium]|nr:efflux RND transporter periplasmic adaptor subunit [Verrucomicrobiales bacterium]
MSNNPLLQTDEVAKTLGVSDSKPRRRRWWLVILPVLLVGLLLFPLLGAKPQPLHYVTEPVERGNLVVTVSATGTLEPLKKVEVGIEVSGTIKSVDVDYNATVKVGQVMAELDTTRLEAQAQQNEAALQAAQARVLQAQASVQEAEAQLIRLNRVHDLSDGRVPSQNELDTAKANVARYKADEASAKASVAQAQAALDVVRTDITKAVIKSPINGVVLERSVEPGQTVAAQFQSPTLFTLAEDLTQMELQVDVDEADVGQVKEGQVATFTVDAYPDVSFPASITQVRYGSQTVEGVVTYKAVLKVDNSSLALRPGMTATAVITVNQRENVLLVPNAALRFAPRTVSGSGQAPGRGLVGMLLPRPPNMNGSEPEEPDTKSREQRVWTVRDGQLVPLSFTKGLSDGLHTEVVSGQVESGLELVTDEMSAPR